MSLLTSVTVKYSLERFSRLGSLRGGPSWFFAFVLDFPENDFWFDFFDMSENLPLGLLFVYNITVNGHFRECYREVGDTINLHFPNMLSFPEYPT